MRVLLTYDIVSGHSEFKKELKKLGFKDFIVGDKGLTVFLPNTSLWIDNVESAAGIRDTAKDLSNRLNIKAKRLVAFEFNSWAGITGEPHDEN